MIDFACKQFKIEEVIKCSLGLTKADLKVMVLLTKNSTKWYTTDLIAEKMELNLSTAQRAVKKLHEKDILKRMQNNLDGGGYVYAYQVKDKDQIITVIMSIVNNWVNKVEAELSKW